jgi:Xaa-Pro aminopeptidase
VPNAMLTKLPTMDVAGRIPRVRERFESAGIDGLLVTRLPNVRYLTGFTGSAGMLLITGSEAVFVTDGRYKDQSAEQIAETGAPARVGIGTTQTKQSEILREAATGVNRLGLEAYGVTWAQQRQFGDWFPGAEMLATEHLVEDFREVKDPGEIARVRAACAIADDALADTLPFLQDAPTERDFALRLEFAMRERGASGVSFDAIVASGPNGAKPHARPSDRTITPHELVVIDFGCIVDGYCSDMTRTVSVGDPGPEARHLWDTVLLSQQAGRAAVAVGVECSAVDRACREIIDDAGWGDAFVHGTGHGVGLEIHEDPRVAATSSGTLTSGHVVTVEPGVYLPGVGGVRIEDTVVVTADGHVALTEFPKDLVL